MIRVLLVSMLWACADDPSPTSHRGPVEEPTPAANNADEPIDTGPTDTGAPLSYAADIEPLWTGHCTEGCHPGSDSMADLRDGFGWADLVDVPAVELPTMDRVQAGDPTRSYLMHKLDGTHIREGGMGPPMPPTGVLFGESERERVRRWILQGAAP